jgi:hypothetical protein
MRRWSRLNPLVTSLMISTATQAPAGTSCKPVITFEEVRFSEAQNQRREWTATVSVVASRCAETSGQFDIKLVRLKEIGPDLLFTERFNWTPGRIEVSLEFWWDEAVQDYWVGDVAPCECAG